jgi:hypothetical protein
MRHWMLAVVMTIGGLSGLAHASEALTLAEAIEKGLEALCRISSPTP